jgi:hypothetical protein
VSGRDDWFTARASDEPDSMRSSGVASDTCWCESCHMIHATSLSCAVVAARIEAMIIEVGDELGEDDLAGADRITLIGELRLRGISLEPNGAGWRAIATVAP